MLNTSNAEQPVSAAHLATSAGDLVDSLGILRAEIAELQEHAKSLEAAIVALGLDRIEGRAYRAAITHNEGRTTIDWKAIAERFEPSRQLVSAHTRVGAPFVTVRVSARSKAPQ